MVSNTSELLPEPELPCNSVSRRLGSSTLMSLRLFTRAPCTRIRSWLSATWAVAMVIMSPSVVAGGSDQPAAVAQQLAVGQLVHLAPGLDAARGDAEPAVRGGQRPRGEGGGGGGGGPPLPGQG